MTPTLLISETCPGCWKTPEDKVTLFYVTPWASNDRTMRPVTNIQMTDYIEHENLKFTQTLHRRGVWNHCSEIKTWRILAKKD